ncbi:N-6 DNA methylase [Actinomadura sp. LD22]|uniref:site-specific DNA-methyltransferase (adenine-specific) n=1 Tax=Actinomadura physcomitrii TaxID=2650748 RepID=A0A6I4MDP3_9ACTN|nr:DNA methyltransferase [Actinomadura physcomitrii]MWA01941.1 N-6 DNA methylase [Actinomadura physcomitrii]
MTSPYTAVTVEGGLLSADLIERIRSADRDLPGNRPEDYHLAAGERLGEAASRKWEYLKGAYAAFRDRLAALPDSDPATTETRERWLLRLFDELGYGRLTYLRGGIAVGDRTYPISHRWGEHVAVHLLGWHADLDRRTGHRGESARAPQSMVQEFLNGSDAHLWGVLSNGRLLRIVRDSKTLVSSAYVQFDLEAIFDGDLYPEFVQLFAMLHSSRLEPLPREDGGEPTVADCWLERWRDHAIETGSRAREQLRKNVEKALNELGTGFLEANPPLREELTSGRLTRHDFHHELLRLAYQLIFLFVAEGRGALLLPDPPDATPGERAELNAARDRYTKYFSVERLRRIASRRRGDRHPDLWRTLVVVLDALGSDEGRPELALPALGGLFFRAGDPLADGAGDGPAPDLLRACELTNERLLGAIRLLTTFKDRKGRLHRVDYRHLDAEELGSVYESLLELEPRPDCAEAVFRLEELPGNQRKTTGSYYTPTALIDELLKTTLDPVIDEYAKDRNPDDLLKITVCDPACGSGHFLVAAARRIARRYAALWNDEEEPTPATIRDAMHKVVGRCLYGVDLNPMAAELAKVSLWLESLQPGRPLAFLDTRIKVGNSLLGTTPKLLFQGIPDEAYKAIGDDDKKVITDIRRQNAKERGRQLSLHDEGLFDLGQPESDDTAVLTEQATALNRMRITSIADIREQARRFRALLGSPNLAQRKRVADAWCAAFVFPKQRTPRPITTATLKIMGGDETARDDFPQAAPTEEMERELTEITKRYQFFHWHLEFPDVFRVGDDEARDANPDTGWQGGFSCVLGNPPWERVKLQEQEFFASRSDEIATAANAAARKKLINALKDSDEPTDRSLYADFQAELRKSTGWSQMLRSTGRYPLTGRGDVNTYSVFAETARTIIATRGRSGLVLPTGIATDATTAPFFGDLVRNSKLVSFLEFENEEFLLSKDVHHSFRFCLLSTAGRETRIEEAAFSFGARQISDIENRRFTMPPEDILLLNPNTGTAPLFRSRRDAKITLEIYRRVPVLWQETPRNNPWGVSFMAMFHMANDSGLFKSREELESQGWVLEGNIFIRDDNRMLPLYEAKMVHHFDHRLGTYEGQSMAQANMGTLPRPGLREKENPYYRSLPRYWVDESAVIDRLKDRWGKNWLLGWRDICRSTDERTLISSVFPLSAAPDGTLLMFPTIGDVGCLLANLSSHVLDYVVRQKSGGTHLKYFTVKQLPVLAPKRYRDRLPWDGSIPGAAWIESRVRELTFTAWDVKEFARDMGDKGAPFVWHENRRFAMRAELDAAYFHLYGIERDDVGYIMDSFGAFRRNDPERFERTKALILDVYDAMAKAIETGEPYKTILDPPPGQGPRHPER